MNKQVLLKITTATIKEAQVDVIDEKTSQNVLSQAKKIKKTLIIAGNCFFSK